MHVLAFGKDTKSVHYDDGVMYDPNVEYRTIDRRISFDFLSPNAEPLMGYVLSLSDDRSILSSDDVAFEEFVILEGFESLKESLTILETMIPMTNAATNSGSMLPCIPIMFS